MKTFTLALGLLLGVALAFAWAGLICLNSGEPDFTEHFWSFAAVAFWFAFGLLAAGFVYRETVR